MAHDWSQLVVRSEVDAIRATGPDVVSFLQGQLSQDVAQLAVGETTFSLLLAPQGKLDAWLRITKLNDSEVVLFVDKGFGEAVLKRLHRFKMRVDVTFAAEQFDRLHYPQPANVGQVRAHHDGLGHTVGESWSSGGIDAFVPCSADPLIAPEFQIADDAASSLARIRAAEPAMGSELNEATIPAEAGIVDRSTSFTKGCYTGQELVARVDSRGSNTPRKLRAFSGGSALPTTPIDVETNTGDVMGTLTSVAVTSDGWVGLGYIKRSTLDEVSGMVDGAVVSIAVPAHMETS